VSIPAESIYVGQCYLTEAGPIRRVLAILSDGRVQYEQRAAHLPTWYVRRSGVLDLRFFAAAVERPIPCNWTPEGDE